MSKSLFLIRGLPGAGKSTVASLIEEEFNIAADDYFDLFYDGEFVPSKIKQAHEWCKESVEEWMSQYVVGQPDRIAVHNTFTQQWEMEDYEKMAEKHGYAVYHIIVENRHDNESVHNVPEKTVDKMRKRFEVEL